MKIRQPQQYAAGEPLTSTSQSLYPESAGVWDEGMGMRPVPVGGRNEGMGMRPVPVGVWNEGIGMRLGVSLN